MELDLRFALGGLFIIIGALMLYVGFTANPEIYHKSLDININAVWGAVMVAFGASMLLLALAARGRNRKSL